MWIGTNLWFGGHRFVGVQVIVPSLHATGPPGPPAGLWGGANDGMAIAAAAIAAAPRARRLLTFNVPPEGHGVAEGWLGDDAGAGLPSPSALQVLQSKFGHPTHGVRDCLDFFDDPVDAAGECLDVVRVDGREHRDPQLVAPQ